MRQKIHILCYSPQLPSATLLAYTVDIEWLARELPEPRDYHCLIAAKTRTVSND